MGRLFGLGVGGGSAITEALLDFWLCAESALLIVAVVWLEYPESLAASGPTTSTVFTLLKTDECDRLAATLALAWPATLA